MCGGGRVGEIVPYSSTVLARGGRGGEKWVTRSGDLGAIWDVQQGGRALLSSLKGVIGRGAGVVELERVKEKIEELGTRLLGFDGVRRRRRGRRGVSWNESSMGGGRE